MPDQEFPRNSIRSKHQEVQERPEIQKVISGNVRNRPKTVGRKLRDTFLGTDARSVGEYLFEDVFIPTVQNLVVDTVKRGIEMLILGTTTSPDRRSYNTRIPIGGGYDYSGISTSRRRESEISRRRMQINKYHRLDDDDLIFETVADAYKAFEWLRNLAEDYTKTSIADYYQLIGIDPESSDFDYGWYFEDLKDIDPKRIVLPVREGYLLDLPETQYIGK